eukprot:1444169-Rhodomonas_salina.1
MSAKRRLDFSTSYISESWSSVGASAAGSSASQSAAKSAQHESPRLESREGMSSVHSWRRKLSALSSVDTTIRPMSPFTSSDAVTGRMTSSWLSTGAR